MMYLEAITLLRYISMSSTSGPYPIIRSICHWCADGKDSSKYLHNMYLSARNVTGIWCRCASM